MNERTEYYIRYEVTRLNKAIKAPPTSKVSILHRSAECAAACDALEDMERATSPEALVCTLYRKYGSAWDDAITCYDNGNRGRGRWLRYYAFKTKHIAEMVREFENVELYTPMF